MAARSSCKPVPWRCRHHQAPFVLLCYHIPNFWTAWRKTQTPSSLNPMPGIMLLSSVLTTSFSVLIHCLPWICCIHFNYICPDIIFDAKPVMHFTFIFSAPGELPLDASIMLQQGSAHGHDGHAHPNAVGGSGKPVPSRGKLLCDSSQKCRWHLPGSQSPTNSWWQWLADLVGGEREKILVYYVHYTMAVGLADWLGSIIWFLWMAFCGSYEGRSQRLQLCNFINIKCWAIHFKF